MPPKQDGPVTYNYVYLKCVGGVPPPPAALAPRLGAFGIPPKKVGDDIAKVTKNMAGIKVQVKLSIANRQAEAEIIPSSASLVLKALKEPVRDRKKVKNVVHDGNITFADVMGVVHVMKERSLAKTLKACACEILGTCQSIGCTVDGRAPHDVIESVWAGEMDDQIV